MFEIFQNPKKIFQILLHIFNKLSILYKLASLKYYSISEIKKVITIGTLIANKFSFFEIFQNIKKYFSNILLCL